MKFTARYPWQALNAAKMTAVLMGIIPVDPDSTW